MYPKRHTPRNIIIKIPTFQYKEKTLKAVREKPEVRYKEVPIRLADEFSTDTLQGRRQ